MGTPSPDDPAGVVSVVLVEDHELVLQAFTLAFDEVPDIDIVAQARLISEGVAATGRHRPDVVLLDRRLPDGDGIDAIGQFRNASPASRVLVLTGYADEPIVSRSIEAGAAGMVLKAVAFGGLTEDIRRVAAGERVFAPELAAKLPGGPAASGTAVGD